MIEINPEHISVIKTLFGEKVNINCNNFLGTTGVYDMIIGNPPFNCNGPVKVPTNTKVSKKSDGASIWQKFIKHSIKCLKGTGYLALITPSIWMKADHSMYTYMTRYNIKKIHTMTNTETNRVFHGRAQTPTCYFTLVKMKTHDYPPIAIYDTSISKYVKCEWRLSNKFVSLPLFAQYILQRFLFLVDTYGSIDVIKTSMLPDYK